MMTTKGNAFDQIAILAPGESLMVILPDGERIEIFSRSSTLDGRPSVFLVQPQGEERGIGTRVHFPNRDQKHGDMMPNTPVFEVTNYD